MLQDVDSHFCSHFSPFPLTLYTFHPSVGWWKKLCFPYLLLEPKNVSFKNVNKKNLFQLQRDPFSDRRLNRSTPVQGKKSEIFSWSWFNTRTSDSQENLSEWWKLRQLSSGNTEEPQLTRVHKRTTCTKVPDGSCDNYVTQTGSGLP